MGWEVEGSRWCVGRIRIVRRAEGVVLGCARVAVRVAGARAVAC